MGSGWLNINLDALKENWRALDAASDQNVETGAVVKADGYGLGAASVSAALAAAGARTFFIALAEEGISVRTALGPGPEICVFSGHMAGDTALLRDYSLTPILNSTAQWVRHGETLPDHPFGIQLDTGMNRLGMELAEWSSLREAIIARRPRLVMSHLACADELDHPMNALQLARFRDMTDGLGVPLSLSATGGILLGPDYHFDLTRPGIGLFGGLPFAEADQVISLSLPVIQVRDLAPGETVGYGNTWVATAKTKIATVSAGYADGLIRAMGNKAMLHTGGKACPVRGRVSMDLITVDVSELSNVPDHLDILSDHQSVDQLAEAAGTIGYEVLTSLGSRYHRSATVSAA